MVDTDPKRPIPGLHQNDQLNNGISSSLQRQTHAAGDHYDQPATSHVRTNKNHDGVQTFDHL